MSNTVNSIVSTGTGSNNAARFGLNCGSRHNRASHLFPIVYNLAVDAVCVKLVSPGILLSGNFAGKCMGRAAHAVRKTLRNLRVLSKQSVSRREFKAGLSGKNLRITAIGIASRILHGIRPERSGNVPFRRLVFGSASRKPGRNILGCRNGPAQ